MSKIKKLLELDLDVQFQRKLKLFETEFVRMYDEYILNTKKYDQLTIDCTLSDKVEQRKLIFESKDKLLHAVNVLKEIFGEDFHKVYATNWRHNDRFLTIFESVNDLFVKKNQLEK